MLLQFITVVGFQVRVQVLVSFRDAVVGVRVFRWMPVKHSISIILKLLTVNSLNVPTHEKIIRKSFRKIPLLGVTIFDASQNARRTQARPSNP